MAGTYSQNDTQVFVKSCVSFFGIDMSIHKLADLRSVLRSGTVKNVYETQRTDDPYTACLLFCPGSASAVAGPLTQPGRQHLSEELRRRRSMLPTLRQRREIGRKHCRAARPAGRPREFTGERAGMNRRYVEKVRRMHRECTDGVIMHPLPPGLHPNERKTDTNGGLYYKWCNYRKDGRHFTPSFQLRFSNGVRHR